MLAADYPIAYIYLSRGAVDPFYIWDSEIYFNHGALPRFQCKLF